ncbi:YIP1 family protein [Psychromarinibacter sp. C21-152]|uniref:YIP1 family protein n=1 Tax=Psychromarinibacter sediminicola TaxID=3033385 RepID=A0AAE3T7A8_9RHOB|nr:YIP1 family protein [Psychromarinibacter sediminicola]MDF0599453.1 YIP1 family protein [Psychromarinibacter sediminicola]
MAVTTDIAGMYVRPRAVVRRLLSMGQREDRALLYLMLSCGLIFVAQWPRLSREAYLDPEVPLQALIGGALLAWLFLAPLILYALAALTRIVARVLGGQGTWFTARLALFWSLLAAVPAWLLTGLVAGFVGPGPALSLTGALAFGVFLLFWGLSLWETERTGLLA